MNFHKTFPFPQERLIQKDIIDQLEKFWNNSGKDIFCINAGTGVGKSAIAIAILRALETKSIITTPQKLLQEQYVKDFGNKKHINIREVKGRSNFQCVHEEGSTCAEGPGAFNRRLCPQCPYEIQKEKAKQAQIAVMNFPYYMAISNTNAFEDREVLVIDEAHSLAEQLVSHAELKVTDIALHRLFGRQDINVPEFQSLQEYEKWLKTILETLELKIKKIEKIFDIANVELDSKEETNSTTTKEMRKDYERFKNFMRRINNYFGSKDNVEWIWSFSQERTKFGEENVFIMKPLDVKSFAENLIFRNHKKVILMSATLLEKKSYCRTLGINSDCVAWIDGDSPFPSKNHQFLLHSVGKMNRNEIDDTLPKLMPVLKKIIKAHKGEKGVIHCNSFKITNFIRENIKDKRLLIQESGQSNRDIYDIHRESSSDTILVSPSMGEGIDLIGDLGKFQIIMKLPFLSLHDTWTKTKSERDNDWYCYCMVRSFVQMLGRIQRTMEDECITYCMDPSFNFFIKFKYKHLLPKLTKQILGVR